MGNNFHLNAYELLASSIKQKWDWIRFWYFIVYKF